MLVCQSSEFAEVKRLQGGALGSDDAFDHTVIQISAVPYVETSESLAALHNCSYAIIGDGLAASETYMLKQRTSGRHDVEDFGRDSNAAAELDLTESRTALNQRLHRLRSELRMVFDVDAFQLLAVSCEALKAVVVEFEA